MPLGDALRLAPVSDTGMREGRSGGRRRVDSAHLDGQDLETVMREMEREKTKRNGGGWGTRR
jgi:hypothetical protein